MTSNYRMDARSAGQQRLVEAINKSVITFCTGPAGTGKTHIPIALAVDALRSGLVERIILCRPVVSASSEIGFLPGELSNKLKPYIRPLYEELLYHYSKEYLGMQIEGGTIEIEHIGTMRGRNYHRSFVVCDEAQNATIAELRLLLTRIGRHSRVVVSGDITQRDLPGESPIPAIANMLSTHDLISFVELTDEDNQRSAMSRFVDSKFASLQKLQR